MQKVKDTTLNRFTINIPPSGTTRCKIVRTRVIPPKPELSGFCGEIRLTKWVCAYFCFVLCVAYIVFVGHQCLFLNSTFYFILFDHSQNSLAAQDLTQL